MVRGITKVGPSQFQIRVRATDSRTGRRKAVERLHEGTLASARALQEQLREELEQAVEQERAPENPTLETFVLLWLGGRQGDIKATTARKIATVWDLHIAPHKIAKLRIDDIRTADVQEWLSELRTKAFVPGKGKREKRKPKSEKSTPRGYSAGTIKGYYRTLAQILKLATARVGARNPCDGIERLKGARRSHNVLALDEVRNVLAHVHTHAEEWFAAVLLDVFSGLRWGELSALKFHDISESEGVIRVRRNNDRGTAIDSTKTGNDDACPKVVPLLPEIAEILKARRKKMVRDQHPGLTEGWIFPTLAGTLHKGSPLRKVLDEACAACKTKRRITTHGLRHTANDLLRRVADGEVVRAITGHVTEVMTHHYSHVDENEKMTAVSTVYALVKGGSEGGSPGLTGTKSELTTGGATQI